MSFNRKNRGRLGFFAAIVALMNPNTFRSTDPKSSSGYATKLAKEDIKKYGVSLNYAQKDLNRNPKGTKIYVFDSNGNIIGEEERGERTSKPYDKEFFRCVSISKFRAVLKFEKATEKTSHQRLNLGFDFV